LNKRLPGDITGAALTPRDCNEDVLYRSKTLAEQIRHHMAEERKSCIDTGIGDCVTEVSVSNLFKLTTGGGANPATTTAPVLHAKEIPPR
jgi:hypothetical protein